MKIRINIIMLLLLACLSALPLGWAQADIRKDRVKAYVDVIRAELSEGKVNLISDVLNLSDKEAEIFWTIYHEYEIELFEIGDRRLELIERFVAAHQGKVLGDSEAEAMAADWFKLSTDRIALFKKYHGIIAKRLSPLIAIQFVQIENRVNMVIDIMIASELPLFKHGKVLTGSNVDVPSPGLDPAEALAEESNQTTADKTTIQHLFVQAEQAENY